MQVRRWTRKPAASPAPDPLLQAGERVCAPDSLAASRLSARPSIIEFADHLFGDGERCAGAGAAGDKYDAQSVLRPVKQHQAIGAGRIGPGPMFDEKRRRAIENLAIFVEDQIVDLGGRERIGRRVIVMGVADDERAVGAAYDNEMHAILD